VVGAGHVVAFAVIDEVVSSIAVDDVIAAAGPDAVVPLASLDSVIVRARIDLIASIAGDNGVVARAGGDGVVAVERAHIDRNANARIHAHAVGFVTADNPDLPDLGSGDRLACALVGVRPELIVV